MGQADVRRLPAPRSANSWTKILERSLSMLNLELYRRGFLPESGAGGRVRTAEDAGAIELSADDLPAVCPRASMPLWALHPRVFLDVVNQNEAMCPYCCTRYRLRRDARVHDHE